jgi:AAA family ATP:ADP antiporter
MSTAETYLPIGFEKRRFLTGEEATTLLFAANVFVLLASYYLLKTVREALILSEAGAAVKSYSAAGQALLLLGVIPAYSYIASRVTRAKLITYVSLFFVSHLACFYVMGNAGFHIGVPFFLWVGIFNVLVIAQFWSFANDLHDSESGKRAFPIIGIGSSLGAWAGARLASRLFMFLDVYQLMLIAAVGLLISIILARVIDANAKPRPAARASLPTTKGGFGLVLSSRYLLLIALMVLTFNLVNSMGEYMMGAMVVAQARASVAAGVINSSQVGAAIGSFYGAFFGWVNLVALLLQVFVVSKVFKYIGVRGALFVLPCIALGSYSLMAVLPVLGVVQIAKVLENSSDYSIQNTARHALFLVTSPEAKYKAKAAIDTFFWRVGDMLQAGVVLAGAHFAFTTRQYAVVNMALVGMWLILVVRIFCEHKRLAE